MESQFPPTTVNSAIEECLAEMEEYLRTLNHADFKIHVNALKAVKVHRRDFKLTSKKHALTGAILLAPAEG